MAMSDDAFQSILSRRPHDELQVELTAAQVDEFRQRGFTQIERITSDAELAWLGELYDAMYAARLQAVPGGYFDLARPYESAGQDLLPQILTPEARFRELRHTALFQNARRLAAQLLGAAASDLQGWGHLIRKPPWIGEALPWHQDEAYWDPAFDYTALGVWMPLDPATVESGCMRFVPGSHRGGVRVHRHLNDDATTHGLVTEGVDDASGVDVPVAPGGATFHHCRMLHMSHPNKSARVRRAWANEFWLEPVRRETPYARPWMDDGQQAWESRDLRAMPRPS
jgi:ectoine hydroxylase-related dioxygenase (phytanoyl-CoA dioxygenase family)